MTTTAPEPRRRVTFFVVGIVVVILIIIAIALILLTLNSAQRNSSLSTSSSSTGPIFGSTTSESTTDNPFLPVTSSSSTAALKTEAQVGQTSGTQIKVYLIDLAETTSSSPDAVASTIGCGDRVVPVTRVLSASSTTPIASTLTDLFSIEGKNYGQSGLYNALGDSDLTVKNISVGGTTAYVDLTGTYMSGGVCDDPRAVAQIDFTVRQFSWVKTVEITLNGEKFTTGNLSGTPGI